MKLSLSPPGKLDSQRALTCALTNQFATPGLGSLLGGRYLAGACQLLLAVTGFVLVFAWFALTLRESYRVAFGEEQPQSYGWLGLMGASIFAVSWLWSLVTSILMLRQARKEEKANQPDQTPPGPSPPTVMH